MIFQLHLLLEILNSISVEISQENVINPIHLFVPGQTTGLWTAYSFSVFDISILS